MIDFVSHKRVIWPKGSRGQIHCVAHRMITDNGIRYLVEFSDEHSRHVLAGNRHLKPAFKRGLSMFVSMLNR